MKIEIKHKYKLMACRECRIVRIICVDAADDVYCPVCDKVISTDEINIMISHSGIGYGNQISV